MKLRFYLWMPFALALFAGAVAPGFAQKTNSIERSPNISTNAAGKETQAVAKVEIEIPKSLFVIPTNAVAGKDPFFPKSIYPYGTTTVIGKTNPPVPVVTLPKLVLSGISGTTDKPLAIINNATFGVGDAVEIPVGPGKRILVRCLEINLHEGTAVVVVSGQREMLSLKNR